MSAMSGLTDGKVVIITGAGSGIGRASAQLFAAEGAKVVCVDLAVADGEGTVALIGELGGDAIFVGCDVTQPSEVQAAVRAAVERYGRLDAAFNNAGIEWPRDKLLGEYALEDLDRTLNVNLRGVWLCMHAELRQMQAQDPIQGHGRGVILNNVSVAGLGGTATLSAYSASKHGVIGLTKSAAREYAPKGIRINAICPGGTRTPMAMETFGGDLERASQALAGMIPMARLAEPREIAEAVVWLCSDRASYITGAALPVDGGFSCGWGWQTPTGKILD
jgi:NAD(P)-dependent dehydrogenase (short-subunit alcohol dehydrogenase family)